MREWEHMTKTMKIVLLIVALIIIILLPLSTDSHIEERQQDGDIYISVEPGSMPELMAKYQDELFWKIAKCESRLNPLARNPASSASGIMQFLDSSWYYYGKMYWGEDFYTKDKLLAEDNVALGWYVYQTVGVSPWEESSHCWNDGV